MCDNYAFEIAQIEWIETVAIPAYRAAILAVTTGSQMYRLNTGQSDMMVTKGNIASVQRGLESLMNERATLRALVYGTGVTHVRPAF